MASQQHILSFKPGDGVHINPETDPDEFPDCDRLSSVVRLFGDMCVNRVEGGGNLVDSSCERGSGLYGVDGDSLRWVPAIARSLVWNSKVLMADLASDGAGNWISHALEKKGEEDRVG